MNETHNKSMDVRTNTDVVWFANLRGCLPHVISTVRFLSVSTKRAVKVILFEEEISLMLTETITLQVESDVARFYNDAPQTDKQKLQALFGNWLRHYAEADVDSLKRTMDEISRNANSRGLTPEILESLLADE